MSQQLINDSNDLFSKIWVEVVSAALEGALVDLPFFFLEKRTKSIIVDYRQKKFHLSLSRFVISIVKLIEQHL